MERLSTHPEEPAGAADGPLAARMRPRRLDEFVGQEHLLGEGSALRASLEAGAPHSMVLYGPPGTGKTTLARLAAEHASAAFEELSAVNAGRAEVREVIARATERKRGGRATIFFLDEIHRFNKAQQDALLPAVEEGLVTLIGATTENPYFEVNSALLSRAQVYELQALDSDDLEVADAARARARRRRGHRVPDDVIAFLAVRAGGDARTALNALELAVTTAQRAQEPRVTLGDAEDALQRKAVLYDKAGDQHYDYISAWIKSTRGSDPDASLYYLAAMVEGGEDPRFIARRMIILASEDIGNADPQALPIAVAAAHAVEHVGLPEAEFALAQAAIYLSLAPKSDAVKRALGEVHGYIREHGAKPPPPALQSAAYPAARKLGRGKGYDYPHEHPGHVNDQEHLPEGLEGLRFYFPDEGEPEAARAAGGDPQGARPRRNNVAVAGRPRRSMRLLMIALFATLPCRCPAARRCGAPGRRRDAPAGRELLAGRGIAASEGEVARLLAFDPGARAVICACAPVDGRETVVGDRRDRAARRRGGRHARGRRGAHRRPRRAPRRGAPPPGGGARRARGLVSGRWMAVRRSRCGRSSPRRGAPATCGARRPRSSTSSTRWPTRSPTRSASRGPRACSPSCCRRSAACTTSPTTGRARCATSASGGSPCCGRAGARCCSRRRSGSIAVRGGRASPWAEPVLETGAALLAGNAVVLSTPLGERIRAAFERGGVPPELIAVVAPDEDLSALADRIVDTRPPESKGTMVVLDGAPLERTVTGALWAAFAGGGRHRAAVGRLVVVPSVAEAAARRRSWPAPSACTPATRGSPTPRSARCARPRPATRVEELVEEAVAEGATLLCGGPLDVPGVDGAFYAPAVLRGVKPGARILREPVPGPVLAVSRPPTRTRRSRSPSAPPRSRCGRATAPTASASRASSRPRSPGSTSTATRSPTPPSGSPATSSRAGSPRSRRGCAPPAGSPTTRSSCAPRPRPRG